MNRVSIRQISSEHSIDEPNQTALSHLLSTLTQKIKVIWFDTIDSTNRFAKTYFSCGEFNQNQLYVFIANSQSAGRGQSNRHWLSPPGNIYLTLLAPLKKPIAGRLSLECALSVAKIPLLKKANMKVKWPNDLYLDANSTDLKVGGILIEPCDTHVILGVGLNIQPMTLPEDSRNAAGHIPVNVSGEKIHLIYEIVCELWNACKLFELGSVDLPERFRHVDMLHQHRLINLDNPQQEIGTGKGINPEGAYITEYNGTIQTHFHGTLRRFIPSEAPK